MSTAPLMMPFTKITYADGYSHHADVEGYGCVDVYTITAIVVNHADGKQGSVIHTNFGAVFFVKDNAEDLHGRMVKLLNGREFADRINSTPYASGTTERNG